MKNLKVTLLPFIMVLFASMLILSSCGNDSDVERSAYLGTFSVVEECGLSGTDNYTITITADPDSDNGIIIDNFYGFDQITATVDGDKLDIPNQTAGGTDYSGSGKLDGDELTIDFTVGGFGLSDNCEATCTRQ